MLAVPQQRRCRGKDSDGNNGATTDRQVRELRIEPPGCIEVIYPWRPEDVNLSSVRRGRPNEKHTRKYRGCSNDGPSETTVPMSEMETNAKRAEKDKARGEREDNAQQKCIARNCQKRCEAKDPKDEDVPEEERDGKVERRSLERRTEVSGDNSLPDQQCFWWLPCRLKGRYTLSLMGIAARQDCSCRVSGGWESGCVILAGRRGLSGSRGGGF